MKTSLHAEEKVRRSAAITRRAFGLFALGAARAAQEAPTFSADVNLVVLNATVRGDRGFVPGLQKNAFTVYEDGVRQAIRIFQQEDAPAAIGLVVDHSGSMRPKRQDVTAAALAFARSSNPQDQMFVVNFNEHVRFGLPSTELFSATSAELVSALDAPDAGKTALYDAILAALERLNRATLARKALIVISDGADNASGHIFADTIQSAARSDALIYTIGLFDEYDEHRNPGVLRKLADSTGGEAFLPRDEAKLMPVCLRIAEEIRKQYTIGYVPAVGSSRGYRQIRVTATGPRGERYEVRTRRGYSR